MWKSDTSDGPESHQNSNVPKSVAGLNGKQKFFPYILRWSRIEIYFLCASLDRLPFPIFSRSFAPLSTPFAILFVLLFSFSFAFFTWKMATFVSGLSQDFSIRQCRVGGRIWTEPLHWTRNRWTFPPTTRFIPCTVMGSVSGRAVKLFVKTIKHSLSESKIFKLHLTYLSLYQKTRDPESRLPLILLFIWSK